MPAFIMSVCVCVCAHTCFHLQASTLPIHWGLLWAVILHGGKRLPHPGCLLVVDFDLDVDLREVLSKVWGVADT